MKNLPSGVTIAGGGGAPLGGLVQSASADESSEWPTGAEADETFVALSGSDFFYEGSSLFTLGSDCVVTYTGDDDIAIIVSLVGSFQARGADVNVMAYAVSFNGDLVGGPIFGNTSYRAGTALVQGTQGGAAPRAQDNVSCQRRLELSTGDTFFPAAGKGGGIGAVDLGVNNLTMSWIQVTA